VVALNAEIRGTKAKLLEEDLPKLQRLALKKVIDASLVLSPLLLCIASRYVDMQGGWCEELVPACTVLQRCDLSSFLG
jgi:hypothetical protein